MSRHDSIHMELDVGRLPSVPIPMAGHSQALTGTASAFSMNTLKGSSR